MYKPLTGRWGAGAKLDGHSLYQEDYTTKHLSPEERAKLAHVPVPLKHVGADPQSFKSSNQVVQEHTSPGKRAEIHKPYQGTAGAGVALGAESLYKQDFHEAGNSPRGLRHNPAFVKPSNVHLVKPEGDLYKSSNQVVQEHTSPGKRADIHKPYQGTAGAGVALGAESGYDKDYVRLPPISPRGMRHDPAHDANNRANPIPNPPRLKDVASEYDDANEHMFKAKPPQGKAPYFDQ